MKQTIKLISILALLSTLQGCDNDLVEKVLLLERENKELKLKVAELEKQLNQKQDSFSEMLN